MHIAIVDDMPAESSKLTEILHHIAEENCIIFDIVSFESGEAFLAVSEENSFDIVFMDIYMNGITGIETAKELRKTDKHCLLIFLTTSTEHMPDAFSCHAFEYIQKPINSERVMQVMTDVMNILPSETKYIEFNSSRQTIRILYSDFVMAVAYGHYLHITDIRGDVYKTRQTLSEFMEPLNHDRRFLQINKGILVNMEHIASIEDAVCTLENGQAFPIKVRDTIKIKEIWCQYGFEQIRTDQKQRVNK